MKHFIAHNYGVFREIEKEIISSAPATSLLRLINRFPIFEKRSLIYFMNYCLSDVAKLQTATTKTARSKFIESAIAQDSKNK